MQPHKVHQLQGFLWASDGVRVPSAAPNTSTTIPYFIDKALCILVWHFCKHRSLAASSDGALTHILSLSFADASPSASTLADTTTLGLRVSINLAVALPLTETLSQLCAAQLVRCRTKLNLSLSLGDREFSQQRTASHPLALPLSGPNSKLIADSLVNLRVTVRFICSDASLWCWFLRLPMAQLCVQVLQVHGVKQRQSTLRPSRQQRAITPCGA